MKLFKALWYAPFIEYHTRKAIKFLSRKPVRDYHFGVAKYYYRKIYGKEFDQ